MDASKKTLVLKVVAVSALVPAVAQADGILTIYTSDVGAGGLGHAWVVYTNNYTGETRSYGTYPAGVVFDDDLERTSYTAYRTTYVDDYGASQLNDTLNFYLNLGQNAWSPNGNCASFASAMWYAGYGETLSPGSISLPSNLASSIINANMLSGDTYTSDYWEWYNWYYYGCC